MNILCYKFWYQGRQACDLVFRFLRLIDNFFCRRMQTYPDYLRTHHKTNMIQVTQRHNMASHPDESYYRRQYWHWIEKALENFVNKRNNFDAPLVLDLGCGQGRLTLPLAKWCQRMGNGKVIGVDMSKPALDFARHSAGQEGLDDFVEFVENNILSFLHNQASSSCEVVVCTEVFYNFFSHQYKKVIEQVARILAPGGIFIPSFRSRYFNILYSVFNRRWAAIPILLESTEGFPFGPPTKFSWHNVDEITDILVVAGFEVRSFKGIGVCSGIEGDPLAEIAQPSSLSHDEQEELMKLELSLAETMADCGRYTLVEAIRKVDGS